MARIASFLAMTATTLQTFSKILTKIILRLQCIPLTFALPKNGDHSFLYFMANHKATKKDARQAAKRRDRNRYYGKTTRNAIRDMRATSDEAAYNEKLPLTVSMIDKLAKRGIIHKNKANNLKSKLAKKAVLKTA